VLTINEKQGVEMDWSHELVESLIWLVSAFFISLVGFVGVMWFLARCTQWGKQFWKLSWPYFDPRRSPEPLAKLALILLLTLFSVRMDVLFSFWYNGFYSAMQRLDAKLVWFFIGIFSILAVIHVIRTLISFYLQQAFEIYWQVWLNDRLLQRWLGNQAYYRSQHVSSLADNPDQRIQQDVASFVTNSMALSMGLVGAMVSIFAFTIILWGLSGPLTLFGVTMPRAMVYLVYLYVIIATVFAFKLGRPLIRLSFLNEKFNASYRYALIRIREYGESVAFYRGERVEAVTLNSRFRDVIGNAWDIVFRSLKLSGFNLSIAQAAVVFPFIVQLPRYLSKQIPLGDVMQTGTAFGQVQDSLSFFRTSYDTFAAYRAVLVRLDGFLDTLDQVDVLPAPSVESDQRHVAVANLTVLAPNGQPLVSDLTLDISAHQPLLVRGPSGAGKTTLLRAIAGLWPFAEGQITRPTGDRSLFLSQKPYLPLGSLRQAIYYPMPAEDNDHAQDILVQCQLAQLANRLDEEADWTQILSLGEQQRLAFGRIFLNSPDVVFLDEATSAMDEGLEDAMYRLLRQRLPDTVVVSVGHRSTLKPFHPFELLLGANGAWEIAESSLYKRE
jgi:putative ATP-binding cassette transporter